MSLLDTFITEPPPSEVWITIRSSEFSGSGTEADPYNGATIPTSSVAIASFLIGAPVPGTNLTTVTVTTSVSHNLKTGDIVKIEGATDSRFNASFPVTVQSDTAFTCTVWNIPPSPAPTGGTCRKDPYLFDAVMRKLQQANVPVRVRIGPGVFETKGYGAAADQVSWRPISGMKMVGSGLAVAISLAAYLPGLSNFDANQNKFSIFRNVSILNNVIRYVSSVPWAQTGDVNRDLAIQVLMPEKAVIAQNVIDLTYDTNGSQVPDPIRHRDGKAVYYFQNTDASGRFIQGLALNIPAAGVNSKVQEISTLVEEAFALSML